MDKIVAIGKVHQLYTIIKNDIEEGQYRDGDKLPSIRALSDTYGLSKNTVNMAIAMLLSEGLAEVRNGIGTYVTKRPRKSHMIGVMMFDFSSGMRVESMILEHIQAALPNDYYISLVNHSERYDLFCDGVERLIDAGAVGLLVVPPKDNPEFINDFQRLQSLLRQTPTVFVNRSIPGIELDTYSMDLKKGLEKALDYLFVTGKKKTAVILHDTQKFSDEEKAAYEEYLSRYSLPREQDLLIPWSSDIRVLRNRLVALGDRYDSLIAPDNVMIQLDSVFAKSGRQIPSELSLVAINDTIVSKMHNPPYTSIAFPVERLGKQALLQLIRRIEENRDNPKPRVFRNYNPELIIRKT